ncbi:tail fiber domain-containing protein [Joostella sp. CR20]|uniref:tail fiber domain-containing protein n=1 Tax=Joostella sp. CR20 TaxID=2804312 RepID=UPI00313E38CD
MKRLVLIFTLLFSVISYAQIRTYSNGDTEAQKNFSVKDTLKLQGITRNASADSLLVVNGSGGVKQYILTSDINSSGGSVSWGSILGDINTQTDLMDEFDNYVALTGNQDISGIKDFAYLQADRLRLNPYDLTSVGYGSGGMINYNDEDIFRFVGSQANAATLFDHSLITADRTFIYPDKSGTIALISDISGNSYVGGNNITIGAGNSINHDNGNWIAKTNLSGATVISNLNVDTYGHLSNWSTRSLTAANIGAEPSFSKNTAFNKNFGTTSGTVLQGNWRPSWSDVTGKPTTFNPSEHTHSNLSLLAGNHLSGGGNLTENRTLSLMLTTDNWIVDSEGNNRMYFAQENNEVNGVIFELSNDTQFQFRNKNNITVAGINYMGDVLFRKGTFNSGFEGISLIGSGTGISNVSYTSFYESNGTTRQGYVGFPSSSNSNLTIRNDVSNSGLSILEDGGINSLVFNQASLNRIIYHSGNISPVPTSRNIYAGSHLSGGGDLSTDRSFHLRPTVNNWIVDSEGNNRMYFADENNVANGLIFQLSNNQQFQFRNSLSSTIAYIDHQGAMTATSFSGSGASLTGVLKTSGNQTLSGTLTASNFIISSDRRLKENIQPLGNGYYTYNLKSDPNKTRRYGLIAQQLERSNPELVRTDENGYKSVAYIDFLIKKIAELEKRIEVLEK